MSAWKEERGWIETFLLSFLSLPSACWPRKQQWSIESMRVTFTTDKGKEHLHQKPATTSPYKVGEQWSRCNNHSRSNFSISEPDKRDFIVDWGWERKAWELFANIFRWEQIPCSKGCQPECNSGDPKITLVVQWLTRRTQRNSENRYTHNYSLIQWKDTD